MNIAQRIGKTYLWIFAWNLQFYVIYKTAPQVRLHLLNFGDDSREMALATRKFPQPFEKLIVVHLAKDFPTCNGNHYRGHKCPTLTLIHILTFYCFSSHFNLLSW
jgi:hypothetical protein